jgi:hypothetical protein
MRTPIIRRLIQLSVMCAGIVTCSSLLAKDSILIHDKMRNSLVFLDVTATVDNEPQHNTGTGFFVTSDGYILTAYRLVERFGAANPSVKINVSVGGRGEARMIATQVDARPTWDLLLLKIPRPQTPYEPVSIALMRDNTSADLWMAGFRSNEAFFHSETKITSEEGPGGLMTLKDHFESGLRGSPIYRQDGTVIGILKGEVTAQARESTLIPIEYASTLLASAGVEVAFETDVNKYMKAVVAYSYSSAFDLSDDRPVHRMPFFKSDKDDVVIDCLTKNLKTGSQAAKVYVEFNNRPDSGPLGRNYINTSNGSWRQKLNKEQNALLFASAADGKPIENPPSCMEVRFSLEEEATPTNKVSNKVSDKASNKVSKKLASTSVYNISCTILIIGPARLRPEQADNPC